MAQEAEEQERLQAAKKEEALQVAQLRKELVHKPQPIRDYKPLPERREVKPTLVNLKFDIQIYIMFY